jgi:hypothetical protein
MNDLEAFEALCRRHPRMSQGARVVWILILAELRRTGEFPRVYVELRELFGARSTATPYKYVRELQAAGELSPGSGRYWRTVAPDRLLGEILPAFSEVAA